MKNQLVINGMVFISSGPTTLGVRTSTTIAGSEDSIPTQESPDSGVGGIFKYQTSSHIMLSVQGQNLLCPLKK